VLRHSTPFVVHDSVNFAVFVDYISRYNNHTMMAVARAVAAVGTKVG
jgi:hypothetical protein